MSDPPLSNETLGGMIAMNYVIGGLCNQGHEVRRVMPDLAVLAARYGLDADTKTVMDRIVCKECGKPVPMRITARGTGVL